MLLRVSSAKWLATSYIITAHIIISQLQVHLNAHVQKKTQGNGPITQLSFQNPFKNNLNAQNPPQPSCLPAENIWLT